MGRRMGNQPIVSRGPRAGLEPLSRRAFLALAGAAGLAATARAQGKPTLRIAMANSVMTVTYPYVTNAQQLGFFDQEGVNAEVVMGQGSPQVLSLLVAGTVDLVFCNPEPLVQLNADRSQAVKSVVAVQKSQYILAVPEDSPINSVQDLKGKRLGMFSPQSGIDYLKARLMDAGLTVADIEIVPTAFGGQTMAAVRQNQVDALLYWSDALLMMRYAGLKLRDLPKAAWEPGLYQYVGATTPAVIEKKADALGRAIRAMMQGQMMSIISPDLTVEAFWKQYPDQAPRPDQREAALAQNLARVRQQNTIVGVPPDPSREQLMAQQWGDQALETWTRAQDILFRIGSITRKVDPERLFDNRFIAQANQFDRAKLFDMAARK
jgi:NitT/TauT family transport system substrate-binding protein